MSSLWIAWCPVNRSRALPSLLTAQPHAIVQQPRLRDGAKLTQGHTAPEPRPGSVKPHILGRSSRSLMLEVLRWDFPKPSRRGCQISSIGRVYFWKNWGYTDLGESVWRTGSRAGPHPGQSRGNQLRGSRRDTGCKQTGTQEYCSLANTKTLDSSVQRRAARRNNSSPQATAWLWRATGTKVWWPCSCRDPLGRAAQMQSPWERPDLAEKVESHSPDWQRALESEPGDLGLALAWPAPSVTALHVIALSNVARSWDVLIKGGKVEPCGPFSYVGGPLVHGRGFINIDSRAIDWLNLQQSLFTPGQPVWISNIHIIQFVFHNRVCLRCKLSRSILHIRVIDI